MKLLRRYASRNDRVLNLEKEMKKILRISLVLLLLVGIAIAIIYRDQLDAAVLEQWINEAGILGPLLFMSIYVVGTVFFFPGSVLTLAGGALFGPVYGTLYNLTGATIGAALSFLVARYLLSEVVEKKSGGRLKQLKEGVENEGWRFIAFVRLVPLFPFNLLNYALGLTRIKFWHYVIASYVCMLPGGLAYTYFGYIGKEAATGGDGLIQKGLLALALIALILFLPRFISNLRKGPMLAVDDLKKKLDASEELLIIDVRTNADYVGEQSHIQGSLLIPVEDLEKRLIEIEGFKEKSVVTICRTDRRSAQAAKILLNNGFTDVHVIKRGMTDWNAKNYPTV